MTAELVAPRAPSLSDPVLVPSARFIARGPDGEAEYVRFASVPAPETSEPQTRESTHTCIESDSGDLAYLYVSGPEDLVSLEPGDMREPVKLVATSADQDVAALFTAALWNCIGLAGGPRPSHRACATFPGAFTPAWVASLELPTREYSADGQAVALADQGFARHPDRAGLLADYHERPRTWVFERAQETVAWLNLVALHLTELSAGRFPVGAAVYDSQAADRPTAAHWDQWYSAVVQVEGEKLWRIGPDQHEVVTTAGDVLLLPEGLSHAVTTPEDPGFSRHLVFTLGLHTVYGHAS